MKQMITIGRLLLLLLIGTQGISQSAAQSHERLKVPPSAGADAHQTARTPQWKRRSSRTVAVQKTDAGSVEPDRSPAPSAADSERRRTEKIEFYEELRKRLESRLLEWQTAEENRKREAEKSDIIPQESQDPNLPESTDPIEDSAPETESGRADSSPPVPPVQEPKSSPPEPASPAPPENLEFPNEVLVAGPVDRVALADNLYALGEFTLAMEMYEQVNLAELTSDQQFWVQFQNASCLRQIGDMRAAKRQLRILAGKKEAGWMANSSRWWLDMIEDRAELEEQITATQSRLESAGKKSHASTGR